MEIYSGDRLIERLAELPQSCGDTGGFDCQVRTEGRLYGGTSTSQPGETYTLRVSHPDFAAVEATSRAPLPIDRGNIGAELGGRSIDSFFEESARITIRDDAQTQYYALDFVHERVQPSFDPDTLAEEMVAAENVRFTSTSPFLLRGIESPADIGTQVAYRTGYTSDISFANASVVLDATLSEYQKCYPRPDCRPEWLYVDVYAVSLSYFDYVRTLIAYQEGGGEGNPLAEPVQVKSNVSGGLGFFGGRTRTRIQLRGPQ